MVWQSNFLSISLKEGNCIDVNFLDGDFKQISYWLQYFAKIGDAVFMTPKHCNFKSDNDAPVYYCHKHFSNIIEFNDWQWKTTFLNSNESPDLERILTAKENFHGNFETQIIELNQDEDNTISASDILKNKSAILEILFANPAASLNCDMTLSKNSEDVYILSANLDSDWPITLKLNSTGESDILVAVSSRTAS